jgi:3-dehydroquinate dehydratase-2
MLQPLQHVRFCVLIAILLTLAAARRAAAPPPQTGSPKSQLTILVLHGPNLNLLGRREPQIYGTVTLEQINKDLDAVAKELNVNLIKIQSNHEGVLVDAFHKHIDDVDAAIINAAGLSFHSVSIHDAIKAMPFPVIEVHISNLGTRDAIHQNSILTPAVRGTIMGLGWRSYTTGLRAVVEIVREERAKKPK